MKCVPRATRSSPDSNGMASSAIAVRKIMGPTSAMARSVGARARGEAVDQPTFGKGKRLTSKWLDVVGHKDKHGLMPLVFHDLLQTCLTEIALAGSNLERLAILRCTMWMLSVGLESSHPTDLELT